MPLLQNEKRAYVDALNIRFKHHGATAVLQAGLNDPNVGRIAMVSSFGAESVALLHLVAMVDPMTPVLFIDTRLLFTETLIYQSDISERLGLKNTRILRASQIELDTHDPYGALRFSNPDACCDLRKTQVLNAALRGFDGWITGRKRFQGSTRAALDFFEYDQATDLIKINPLAHWTRDDVITYMDENRLPRHPLVARGYPSIGCHPCTSAVTDSEDPRAGRWRGTSKTECGIHITANGVLRATKSGEHA
jgi:phosphoadenosine phosphosulfate reductase